MRLSWDKKLFFFLHIFLSDCQNQDSTQALVDSSERFLLAEEIVFCSVRYRINIINRSQIVVQNSGSILNTNPPIGDQANPVLYNVGWWMSSITWILLQLFKIFFPISLASSVIFCNSNATLVNAMFITDLVQFWHTPILRHSVLFINTRKRCFFTVLLFCTMLNINLETLVFILLHAYDFIHHSSQNKYNPTT